MLEYFDQSFNEVLHRVRHSRYNVARLPKSVLFLHYLLTSPELGYNRVHFEHMYGTEDQTVDLYVEDIKLAIDVDGPVHFFAGTGERKIKLGDRQKERDIDTLRITYHVFERFLANNEVNDFTSFTEDDFTPVKQELIGLIEQHTKASLNKS